MHTTQRAINDGRSLRCSQNVGRIPATMAVDGGIMIRRFEFAYASIVTFTRTTRGSAVAYWLIQHEATDRRYVFECYTIKRPLDHKDVFRLNNNFFSNKYLKKTKKYSGR